MVYEWLSEERAVKDRKAALLVCDASRLTTSKGDAMFGSPYDTVGVHDENGTMVDKFTLAANRDIAWCTMLPGREERVQRCLVNALMMG